MPDLVKITVATPLPDQCQFGVTYKIEGTAMALEKLSAPPWIYAQVQKKDWYKPEILEETTYERGFPIPITGKFSIAWKPEKLGLFEVTLVATPAPLALPLIGVPPIMGQSEMMKVKVVKEAVGEATGLKIVSYEGKAGAASPPEVLDAEPKEIIKVTSEFDYKGPDTTLVFYTALYARTLGLIDEVSGANATQNIPVTKATGGAHFKVTASITMPQRGGSFGLYSKINTFVPVLLSPYYDDVIAIRVVGAFQVKELVLT